MTDTPPAAPMTMTAERELQCRYLALRLDVPVALETCIEKSADRRDALIAVFAELDECRAALARLTAEREGDTA